MIGDDKLKFEAKKHNSNKFYSNELFGNSNEIKIFHNSQEYRLRLTRSGKMILTK